MNAFKLLSRSTNLARKKKNGKEVIVVPSSGAAVNPQLYHEEDDLSNTSKGNETQNTSTSSKKRKRGEDEIASSIDIPNELDFFGTKSEATGGADSLRPKAVDRGDVPPQSEKKITASIAHDQLLSEEQCRQTLQKHKLKITLLNASEPHPTEITRSSKSRKRNRDAESADVASKTKKARGQIIPQPLMKFSQLRSRYNVVRRLAENVEAQGYSLPTEVQLASLPLLLDPAFGKPSSPSQDEIESFGPKIDLLTVAPTGSGKTLAFLVPVLNAILKQRKLDGNVEEQTKHNFGGTQAVILAPTKELASQILNETRKLLLKTGLKVSLVRKGMRVALGDDVVDQEAEDEEDEQPENDELHPQKTLMPVKAHVLVSTPLSLLHALEDGTGQLETVRYLVLDEADVLLDPLFREQTLDVWQACTNALLRVSLWSATMGASIEELATSIIEKRWDESLALNGDQVLSRPAILRVVVGMKDSAIPNIQHKLTYAATEPGKLMALRQLIRPTATSASDEAPLRPPFLVFTQTIPRAIALHSELIYDIPQEAGGSARIAVLHSDLSDSARDRLMTRFRKGEIWVLITTDLLSRGVDFRGVNGVVNYDFPNSSASYVHRVGRTGRAGREGGVAVTLYTTEDIPYLKSVANVIAASERQREGGKKADGIQSWLLDSLPKASKKERQRLKKRGVEVRRTHAQGEHGAGASKKARISTRSGYERRLENKKRGAARGSKHLEERQGSASPAVDEGFAGFGD